MLTISVQPQELYDEVTETFTYTEQRTVKLEHSLISVAKWEAIWHKAFLPGPSSPGMVGPAEEISYISCMIIGDVPGLIPGLIHHYHRDEIEQYIADPHSATTIWRPVQKQRMTQTITAELIYYWMIQFQIPFECEKWHLNRLLTLIDVCNVKNNPNNKLSAREAAQRRWDIIKQRNQGAV